MVANFYEILNIPVNASSDDIKNAVIQAELIGLIDSNILAAAKHALLDQDIRKQYDTRLLMLLSEQRSSENKQKNDYSSYAHSSENQKNKKEEEVFGFIPQNKKNENLFGFSSQDKKEEPFSFMPQIEQQEHTFGRLEEPKKEATGRSPSFWLIIGIIFMPYIFSWFTLKKGYSTTFRAVAFIWMCIGFIAIAQDKSEKAKTRHATDTQPVKVEQTKEAPMKETVAK